MKEISILDEAPPTEFRKRSCSKVIAGLCRQLLDSLRGLTYILADYEKLQDLHQGLQAALVGCQRAGTEDDELVLEQTCKRKAKVTNTYTSYLLN